MKISKNLRKIGLLILATIFVIFVLFVSGYLLAFAGGNKNIAFQTNDAFEVKNSLEKLNETNTSTENFDGTKKYVNNDEGFSLLYPNSWDLKENPDIGKYSSVYFSVDFTSPNYQFNHRDGLTEGWMIVIHKEQVSPDQYEKNYSKTSATYPLSNKYTARQREYSGTYDLSNIRYILTSIFDRDAQTEYRISCVFRQEDLNQFRQSCKDITNTFNLL